MNDDISAKDKKKKKKKEIPPRPFFNANIFGDSYEVEIEEVIVEAPPPPVFSEEEMEAAKQAAFNTGKAEGVQESADSRDQFVAALLSDLTQSMHTLIGAESERDKLFERESVNLSLQVFEQVFPKYYEKHGLEEMRQALVSVIQSEEDASQILIEVHPDYVSDIEQFLVKLAPQLPRESTYDVTGVGSFNASQFKLSWKDGGAVHDIDSIASRIRDILHDVLAGAPANPHDNEQDLPEPIAETTEQPATTLPIDSVETDTAEAADVTIQGDVPNEEGSGEIE